MCVCVHVCVCVYIHVFVCQHGVYGLSHQPGLTKLTTYRDKAPHHLCVCARVCAGVYMHVCASVKTESTTYRIHLASPNANNLQR